MVEPPKGSLSVEPPKGSLTVEPACASLSVEPPVGSLYVIPVMNERCHYAFIHYIRNYALADNVAIIYVIT